METNELELAEIKIHVLSVQQVANNLVVNSPESLSLATDQLHAVSKAEKFITGKKEQITRPLMSSLAKVRDLFRPLESNLADAKKIIKSKMLAYQIEFEEQINKEKEKIERRVEKGTMKAETAVGKLETIGDAPTKSAGEVGKSSIREVRKVRIVDETAIPREFLVPNMTAITEAVLRQNLSIPGVELFLEKSIVSR